MMDVDNCFTYAYSAGTFADFEFDTDTQANQELPNVLDLIGAASPSTIRIGEGKKAPYLIIKVTEAFAGAVSGVSFILYTHTAADVSGGKAIYDTGILNVSQLTLGQIIQIALPAGKYSRYLGLDMLLGSEQTSAGKVVAWIDENAEPDVALLDMDDTN